MVLLNSVFENYISLRLADHGYKYQSEDVFLMCKTTQNSIKPSGLKYFENYLQAYFCV